MKYLILMACFLVTIQPESRSNPFFLLSTDTTTIYVDSASTAENPDGSSWQNAFPSLTTALMEADAGDSIRVAEGTYFPTTSGSQIRSFSIPAGIRVFGGFSNTHTSFSQRDPSVFRTVLDGNIGDPDSDEDNSFHVVTMHADGPQESLLDGFTVQNGRALLEDPAGFSPYRYGGGLYVNASEDDGIVPVNIRNCVFQHNEAFRGGALYADKSEERAVPLRVEECTFLQNSSRFRGGAIYLRGAQSDAQYHFFKACQFLDNTGRSGGSAIWGVNEGRFDMRIYDCLFQENTTITGGGGGAIVVDDEFGSSNMLLHGSTFDNNEANFGAAFNILGTGNDTAQLYRVDIDSCSFRGNQARTEGGAINWRNLYGRGVLNINHTTFSGNIAGDAGSALYLRQTRAGRFRTTIRNSRFLGEKLGVNPEDGGGAIHFRNDDNGISTDTIQVWNSSFADNSSNFSGIPEQASNSLAEFVHCTFYKNGQSPFQTNVDEEDLPAVRPNPVQIRNSLIWEPQAPDSFLFYNVREDSLDPGSFDLRDNLSSANVMDSGFPDSAGQNNTFTGDPLFRDTSVFDLRLLSCSPGVNLGNDQWLQGRSLTQDLDGGPRVLDGSVDVGAYEQPAYRLVATVLDSISCAGRGDALVELTVQAGNGPSSLSGGAGEMLPVTYVDLGPGLYEYVAVDSIGCTDTVQVELLEPAPIQISGEVENASSFEASNGSIFIRAVSGGTPPFRYFWNQGSETPNLTNLSPGTYDLTVVDANSCAETASFEVSASTSLDGIENGLFRVGPNPATTRLHIQFSDEQVKSLRQIRMYNALGQPMWQTNTVATTHQIDMSHWPAGVYWLVVRGKDGDWTGQVMKNP